MLLILREGEYCDSDDREFININSIVFLILLCSETNLQMFKKNKNPTHPVLTYNQIASSQAVSCCNIDAIPTWSQTGPHVFCVNKATIGWVCFFLPWWMSKANYETNSSGTGSFPNVISVNIIIVQMNVNSSTIIVQVELCGHCHSTSSQPFTSQSVMWRSTCGFLYFDFLFSVDFAIHAATELKCTHNS